MADVKTISNTQTQQQVDVPRQYAVVLLNDNFTPMEFVVQLLQYIFGMDIEKASRVMLEVHEEGRGIAGIYSKEVAEMKVSESLQIAQQFGHPLLCETQVI